MVFFYFDLKKDTYIVPFGMHDDLKQMGVYSTVEEQIYYLSPNSNYEVEAIINKIHENAFFMDSLYNINVLNIDCLEMIEKLIYKDMPQIKRWVIR
jgi:hypothetical protein